MEIFYSRKFVREYKKLSSSIKRVAEGKEVVFRRNPFDPSLKTHKLTGKLKNYWSFSLDQKHRIIFEFAKKEVVWFHSVGSHDIYKLFD